MNQERVPTKAANLPLGKLLPQPKGKLKDQFQEVARFRHLSPRTGGGVLGVGRALSEIPSGPGRSVAASPRLERQRRMLKKKLKAETLKAEMVKGAES